MFLSHTWHLVWRKETAKEHGINVVLVPSEACVNTPPLPRAPGSPEQEEQGREEELSGIPGSLHVPAGGHQPSYLPVLSFHFCIYGIW